MIRDNVVRILPLFIISDWNIMLSIMSEIV